MYRIWKTLWYKLPIYKFYNHESAQTLRGKLNWFYCLPLSFLLPTPSANLLLHFYLKTNQKLFEKKKKIQYASRLDNI